MQQQLQLELGTSSGGTGGFQGAPLNGAGSTFAQPLYQLWSQSFLQKEPDAQINYQAIGSGGGIEQFTAQTVDFGATDVPLQSDEIGNLPNQNYIEFPTALGAVVFAYNLQGVDSALKLDGKTISDIFLGNITKWNDPEITGQNPGVNLPDEPIQTVHRSDESGTTAVWTGWLSAESSEWASKVGADKAVQWPVGTGASGNDGVASGISQTEGGAGYLSYDFAVTADLGVADIKAPDGELRRAVDRLDQQGGRGPFVPDQERHDDHQLFHQGRVPGGEHDLRPDLHRPDRSGEGADPRGLLDVVAHRRSEPDGADQLRPVAE